MTLLSVALARAIWLVDVVELNPRGKNLFVDLVPSVISEFKFKVYPQEGHDLSKGMKFTGGVFINAEGDPIDVEATIWNDGIVVDTRSSTDDSEEFLGQVLTPLPDMGFVYDPSMIRKKLYNSQLNIRCSKSLNVLNPKLAEFAGRISSATPVPARFEVASLQFWPDQGGIKPVNFTFERRADTPFDENRYFSQSPTPTTEHIALLKEFETLLSGA